MPTVMHRTFQPSRIAYYARYSHDGLDGDTLKLYPHQAETADKLRDWLCGDMSGLLILGGPGTGKTELARRAARRMVDANIPVLWQGAKRLMDQLRNFEGADTTAGPPDMRPAAIRDRLHEAPVLVIDDLGAERPTPFVQEELTDLFDARYEQRTSTQTLVTTNLTGGELASRLGERAMSRLAGLCEIIRCEGPDLRQALKANANKNEE